MSDLVWTADLNTGIDDIDGQHQQIVDFINRLNAVRNTGDTQEISSIIDGLVDYTLLHFAFEEALLAEAGYAALSGHQKVHDLFAKRIQQQLSNTRHPFHNTLRRKRPGGLQGFVLQVRKYRLQQGDLVDCQHFRQVGALQLSL